MKVVVSMSTYVLAQTPTQTGDTKYRPSSKTIISVTLAILDLATRPIYTKMILCGMVRGVVLVAPANNPPWFCTTLPQPTTDDIELRNCASEATSNEDTLVQLVDI